MKETLLQLKQEIIKLCQNPNFIHHKWFVKYHLEIVEKIAMELCDIYKEADRDLVFAMVWFHDYGKIVDSETKLNYDVDYLLNIGFDENFSKGVIENTKLMDKSKEIDLSKECIEVQIMSSADGASHMIGPFLAIYFQENSSESVEKLSESNIIKIEKDWNRKMVLHEVRERFENNHKALTQLFEALPERIIN